MKSITINVPETVHLQENEIVKFLAAKLYETGDITLKQAAQLAEMKTVEFAEILSRYDVSLFNYPPSDIPKDAAHA